MTNQRSQVWNAFETTLAASMNSTATTAQVVTVGPVTSLTYLCIDPDDPTKREYVLVGAVSDPNLNALTRYLSGSAAGSGLSHDSGATVRSVPLQQMWEDTHDRIDFFGNHANLAGLDSDSHPHYLNSARHDLTDRHEIGGAILSGAPLPSAPGDVNAEGVAESLSRTDHVHGREGFGVPNTSQPGDTVVEGVATTVARSDHRHGREALVVETAVVVKLSRSASQAINSATLTEILWDLEHIDTHGMHAPSSGSIVITLDGKYLCLAGTSASTNGTQFFVIQKNGTGFLQAGINPITESVGTSMFTIASSGIVDCLVGDVIRMVYQQNSGGSRNVHGGNGTFLELVRLGA